MRSHFVLPLLLSIAAASAVALPLACNADAKRAPDPTYRDDVSGVLDAKCARCHAGDAPPAGYRTNSYREAIGCVTAGGPAVLPSDASPFARALDRPDHRDLVTSSERATLIAWVEGGAQSVRPGVHPSRFADPRAPSNHAQTLRDARYAPLLDANDRDACVRCHDGAGPRPAGITTAPGATSCTTCHAEKDGVNACTTCHGAPGRAYPPRDACFFPDASKGDVHAAHGAPTRSRAEPLDCSSCHPKPALGALQGAHGDGHVEVWFDYAVAGREARFDTSSRKCTGTCHDRGGSQPGPAWVKRDVPLDCNGCHSSPPPAHYPGPCASCHREADALGTALIAPKLHTNGKVDLGDGSGKCGACHGKGDSPWPSTGAHAAHASPSAAAPVACETCHEVPGPNDRHPLRAGAVTIRLAGLATKGARPASYDPVTKTCAATYCHDGAGANPLTRSPRWSDGAAARACGSCHATPPPAPHPQGTSCSSATCHEGITNGLTVTAAGRSVHVNGLIDRRVP